MEELLRKILTARVYGAAIETPLDEATTLSHRLDNRILLKREDLQPVFSFKIRGAYNRMQLLTPEERQQGVLCASAGNHAQGVAFSARKLGIEATIVMPRTTPRIKVEAVRRHGARVILAGDSYSDAAHHCEELRLRDGGVQVAPFDDIDVIAGQGTIGMEILRQTTSLDYIFIPIGGGGLIAGVAYFLKTLLPEVRVIGVEPEDARAMHDSLAADEIVQLQEVGIFADGVAVKRVGNLTFELARKYVDEVILVTTDEISSAIQSVYEDTRSIVEPAGALGVAGLKKFVEQRALRDQTLVAINSGANMNFDRLQFVAERTRVGGQREALFAVTIPERPGTLRRLCDDLIGNKSITEFNYRLLKRDQAHIFVGVGIESAAERHSLYDRFLQAGYPTIDLTDNELAKTHIRHMVGGHSPQLDYERIFRFQFPERPGALSQLLQAMNQSWNISLFHYRMHGGDFGRVLVGFENPPEDSGSFENYLKGLTFPFIEESKNPAYRLFL